MYPWNDIVWLIWVSFYYFQNSEITLFTPQQYWHQELHDGLIYKTEKIFTAFYTTKYSFFSFFSHHALNIVYKLLAPYIEFV